MVHERLGNGREHDRDHPKLPAMQEAWVDGYRSVAPLSHEDEAELPTFVMLGRLFFVAWVGSHHTWAPEAAELGADYTAGTCQLAEVYLASEIHSKAGRDRPRSSRSEPKGQILKIRV